MILRQAVVITLLGCFFNSFGQNDENLDDSYNYENIEEVQEYDESDDYSRLNFIEIDLLLSKPTGGFGRNLDGAYLGIGVEYLLQLSTDEPGFIGLGLDYTYLENALYSTVDSLDGFPLDYSTTTSMASWYVSYRHYLGASYYGISPFVEGRVGINAIWTFTSVSSEADADFLEVDYDNFDTFFNYDITGGLHFAVSQSLHITGKVSYTTGLSAEYDVREQRSVAIDSSLRYFSRKRSTIDVLRFGLGVTFAF